MIGQKKRRKRRHLAKTAAGLWLAVVPAVSCGSEPSPSELVLGQEICSYCRMTIVQPELAAQAVQSDRTDFFDEPGCLARWVLQQSPPSEAALFVADFENGRWLDARKAFYVQSASLPTPMGSGLAAYGDEDRAGAAARRLQGRILSWQQVLEEAKP